MSYDERSNEIPGHQNSLDNTKTIFATEKHSN